MSRSVRHVVAGIALVALVAGTVRLHPCIDDDSCPSACDADRSAAACAAPEGGHDHEPAAHVCDCPCHVPGIASRTADGPVRDAPAALRGQALRDALRPGFPHPPFRPPTA